MTDTEQKTIDAEVENGEEGSAEPAETRDLALVPADEAVALARAAELEGLALQKRGEIIHSVLQANIARTAAGHWCDYGDVTQADGTVVPGDPRPEDEAAYALLMAFGAVTTWMPMGEGGKQWMEVPMEGDAFEILVMMRGEAYGRVVEVTGSAQSTDPFFTKGSRGKRGRALFTDILKKAQANAAVRCFLQLGGSAVTWEMLEAVGIERSKCHKIDFAKSEEVESKEAIRAGAGKPCPKCKTGKLALRSGSRGPFLGCSRYKQGCKYTCDVPPEGAQDAPEEAEQAPRSDDPTPPPTDAPADPDDPEWGDEKDLLLPSSLNDKELKAALIAELTRASNDNPSILKPWIKTRHLEEMTLTQLIKKHRLSAEKDLELLQRYPDGALEKYEGGELPPITGGEG